VLAIVNVATLAWFVGVSPLTMRRFLRDAWNLGLDQLADIGLALQVSLLALVRRAGEIAG